MIRVGSWPSQFEAIQGESLGGICVLKFYDFNFHFF